MADSQETAFIVAESAAVEGQVNSAAAPPSSTTGSSGLSDPPANTDAIASTSFLPESNGSKEGTAYQPPQLSAQTQEILTRVNANAASAGAWEVAREQLMKDMATVDKIATPDREAGLPRRGGRGGKRASFTPTESANGEPSLATSGSTGRGRGRGGGRPRGRGRGGGRGGKRKREDNEEDGHSDSSEEVTSPLNTMTKSGRSVQKPTSFAPPPLPSPTTNNKRKRTYRKNPESAVCKICLRGTSPQNNMIVFCDGCNTPYHRYCHHPPIDQSVVDHLDKEWYCKQCEKERVVPVSEEEVAHFVAASAASTEQRQRYFANLPSGMLVTLLTKATTLKPDLPLFSPEFHVRAASNAASMPPPTPITQIANGHAHPIPALTKNGTIAPSTLSTSYPPTSAPTTIAPSMTMAGASFIDNADDDNEDDGYPDHPPTYPRPGHGLMKTLPPEQDDLQWLVEDDDRYGVFSHLYQVDQQAANASLNGNNG